MLFAITINGHFFYGNDYEKVDEAMMYYGVFKEYETSGVMYGWPLNSEIVQPARRSFFEESDNFCYEVQE